MTGSVWGPSVEVSWRIVVANMIDSRESLEVAAFLVRAAYITRDGPDILCVVPAHAIWLA